MNRFNFSKDSLWAFRSVRLYERDSSADWRGGLLMYVEGIASGVERDGAGRTGLTWRHAKRRRCLTAASPPELGCRVTRHIGQPLFNEMQ